MAVKESSIRLAIRNIARYGDTDVFPYPLENHWFHDDEDGIVGILRQIDRDFDAWTKDYPVVFSKVLTGVGYAGFRAVTQIDPIWNAYLLSLVIELAPKIEAARVSQDRNVIFSYRYKPHSNTGMLFDRDLGWRQFHKNALAVAASANLIISTDISDFYPRIYHHRLENALQQATNNTEVVRRIMNLLQYLSRDTSYGLPVGGHAARLLAELVLSRVDKLMLAKNISFCRFVDDYLLFAQSRGEAQTILVTLSELLLDNEGLALSRAKTRFMSRDEFLRSSPFSTVPTTDSREEAEAQLFLRLRLRFDPYSPTAEEDYDRLVSDVGQFDISRMLARELRKSRIDEMLVRHLIKSLRFMDPTIRDATIVSLLQTLEILYPVFPTVAILLRALLTRLSDAARSELFDSLRKLVQHGSHIALVPINLAYIVRILAHDPSQEVDALFTTIYNQPTDMMVKRDIVLAMTVRRADYWLSNLIKQFPVLSPWEKRALVTASYALGDEGRHWRDWVRPSLSKVDQPYMRWIGQKNSGRRWEIPL